MMRAFIHRHLPAGIASLLFLAPAATARNVDLSTIPDRDSVQLTIYNTEDLTLVRETRRITFSRGSNPLQFSWANTLIDPTSVDLRFKTHAHELDVLDTTFPHDKPQMLYWNVRSEADVNAVVEISYFTSGITWSADYVCVSNAEKDRMSFDGFVRITNNSGEDYENAQVRLVVGQINLVEKVAELARRGIISKREEEEYYTRHRKVARFKGDARAALAEDISAGLSSAERRPKEIIKEGLSEYFIYTIEGTETVKHTWSKRMRLFEGKSIPFEIKYRYRPEEYGSRLVRLFVLRNDKKSELGTTPLPDGIVRLFCDNGRDGLSFLVAHQTKYVPIGQEIELTLGEDPEVIHERVRLRSWRDNFWFLDRGQHRHFSPTRGNRIHPKYTVSGWDDHDQWVERIRNYRDQPVQVEIRRSFNGHIEFISDLEPRLHDFRTPEFTTTVEPGGTMNLAYEIMQHHGYNSKQNNVTLSKAQ